MTLCKKSRLCKICVYILGLGGELLVCATTPLFVFVVHDCRWNSSSSFFVSSSCEQVVPLPLQGLAPVVVWCSCVCDGWCYVSSCSFLSFFMCRKLERWSPTLVIVIIIKDLQAFVATILFRWTMSCLDPTFIVFFACSYFFKAVKLWSFTSGLKSQVLFAFVCAWSYSYSSLFCVRPCYCLLLFVYVGFKSQ
jgi:hypothetical protein